MVRWFHYFPLKTRLFWLKKGAFLQHFVLRPFLSKEWSWPNQLHRPAVWSSDLFLTSQKFWALVIRISHSWSTSRSPKISAFFSPIASACRGEQSDWKCHGDMTSHGKYGGQVGRAVTTAKMPLLLLSRTRNCGRKEPIFSYLVKINVFWFI